VYFHHLDSKYWPSQLAGDLGVYSERGAATTNDALGAELGAEAESPAVKDKER